MTIPASPAIAPPRRLLRSTAALLLGFVSVVVLSLATDQLLHVLHVYPPWNRPMYDPGLNLLALAYRIVYTAAGSWIAAKFAPHHPMRHALILGLIGLGMGVAGVIATSGMDLGPRWYPVAIAVTALPCAWLGGVLHRATAGRTTKHAEAVKLTAPAGREAIGDAHPSGETTCRRSPRSCGSTAKPKRRRISTCRSSRTRRS